MYDDLLRPCVLVVVWWFVAGMCACRGMMICCGHVCLPNLVRKPAHPSRETDGSQSRNRRRPVGKPTADSQGLTTSRKKNMALDTSTTRAPYFFPAPPPLERHIFSLDWKSKNIYIYIYIYLYIYIQIPMALATLCIAGAELPKALVEQHVQ